jgi:LDH2 family malate/lactate/ureidoglycolate dehydrogenase
MATPAADTVRRPYAELERFAHDIFRAMGADEEVATETARHLVRSNLSGHDSHGLIRIPQYVALADAGQLDPAARPVVLREHGVGAVIDARKTFGQYSTRFALDWALEAARKHGMAAAAVRHSTHIGRLGEYVERAAAHGMIAVVTIGIAGPGYGNVVPFRGKRRFLGTNPWTFGFPSARGTPFVYDAATTGIAEGKLRVARAKRAPVPPGAIVDREGNPTTEVEDFYAGGALVGLGGEAFGHKGYGLGLASALMAGLSMIDDDVPGVPSAVVREHWETKGLMCGVFVLAIDPGLFGDAARFAELVADNLEAARREPPAAGADEVLAAGDPEARTRLARQRDGIELATQTWNDLKAVGERFGVAP